MPPPSLRSSPLRRGGKGGCLYPRHRRANTQVRPYTDKQGRINLPQSLVEYAGLSKECRVVGVSDRLEIWSEEKWKSYLGNVESNIDDITESIDFDF